MLAVMLEALCTIYISFNCFHKPAQQAISPFKEETEVREVHLPRLIQLVSVNISSSPTLSY